MKIFVTGSSGFIGRALLQELRSYHLDVCPLQRGERWSQDVNAELARQMRGCEAVVHLAIAGGNSSAELIENNLSLTSSLLAAAIRCHVRRFVHVSSISVYGEPPPNGHIDEQSPRLASLQAYAAMKQACERLALSASDQLEVVVIQPAIVYGPGGGWWTTGLLEAMSREVWPLIDRGRGHCHPVHVSDVAHAIRLSLASPDAPGHCLLITGPMVPWREFLEHYQKIIGRPSLLSVPRSWMLSSTLWPPLTKRIVNKLIRMRYGRPLALLSPEQVVAFAARPSFDGRLAERILGFRPEVSLTTGMQMLKP
jgi:nucleoside-diphosphate-sugar epimerase